MKMVLTRQNMEECENIVNLLKKGEQKRRGSNDYMAGFLQYDNVGTSQHLIDRWVPDGSIRKKL